jgi:tetratricopeptide (TPR) repeat protein
MLKQRVSLIAAVVLFSLVSGCAIMKPKPDFGTQPQQQGQPEAPTAPQPSGAPSEEALPAVPNGAEQHTPTRQFQLSPPARALVEQSRTQASGGNFVAAYATLERAQRIEPNNPLVWIEMGQVKLQEGNAVQADSMGHKALQLAAGDQAAQAQAWHLIADSLKSQGKDPDAANAERKAASLAPR